MIPQIFDKQSGEENAETRLRSLPPPPPWRASLSSTPLQQAEDYVISEVERNSVNAAMILRRPLLITGKPGTGKSSLAHAIARDLDLGDVLKWPITSRSVLKDGQYTYDSLARFEEVQRRQLKGEEAEKDDVTLCRYLRLGPLGTAFATSRPKTSKASAKPRVLLIDEIDKSDIDLPNDMLHVFEDGTFEIPELKRLIEQYRRENYTVRPSDNGEVVSIKGGVVQCAEFPIVIMTSNQEREFSPAFLRRCIRLHLEEPSTDQLLEIIRARFGGAQSSPESRKYIENTESLKKLVDEFVTRRESVTLATDQLLNAVQLTIFGADDETTRKMVFKGLNE